MERNSGRQEQFQSFNIVLRRVRICVRISVRVSMRIYLGHICENSHTNYAA